MAIAGTGNHQRYYQTGDYVSVPLGKSKCSSTAAPASVCHEIVSLGYGANITSYMLPVLFLHSNVSLFDIHRCESVY